ncbi:MAG: hypothetical protein GY714_01960 [Desulfobacterales bacterium]|nr:hypothetical protein [Desulfobacterales bacterium]
MGSRILNDDAGGGLLSRGYFLIKNILSNIKSNSNHEFSKPLMHCKHPVRKYKLVSWATDCRYGHKQGFNHRVCCAICGCIIPERKENKTSD